MKKPSIWIAQVALAVLASACFNQTASAAPGTAVNVNFSLTGAGDLMDGTSFISGSYQQAPSYYSGTKWNEAVGPLIIATNSEPSSSFTQTSLLDSTGAVTTIGFTTASTTTPFDLEGPYSFGDHPNTKMLNGGVRRAYNSGSGNNLNNRLTISGLNNAKVYNIYLTSSQNPNVKCAWRIGAAGTPQTILNTTATRTAQTWKPGDNWVVFYAVPTDGAGNIDVRGQGQAGADAGAFSGITLNGFQVVEATGWLNPDKSIYDFGTPAVAGTSSVVSANGTGNTITWTVLYSSNLAALSPTFTLADNATCVPASGSTQNFSGGPVNYTVTAQDGTVRVYAVTAVLAPPSTARDILSFTTPSGSAAIATNSATLYVPVGTDVTALVPTITLSPFASVSPASGVPQNFTSPVNYTVTAEDGVSTKIYTVKVVPANYWNNDAGGGWSFDTNWNPVAVPTSSVTTTLVFDVPGLYTASNDLASPLQVNQIVMNVSGLILAGPTGVEFAGITPQLLQGNANAVLVETPMELSVDTTLGGSGTGQVQTTGLISGPGRLIKSSPGTLRMNTVANNTYSGGTTILSGTIMPNRPVSFGSGPVTLAGGVIFNQSNEGSGYDGNSPGGAYPNTFILSGGEVTFNVAFGGATDIWTNTEISGSGSIKVIGGGRAQGLTLQGVNTFSGGVTIAGPADSPNVSVYNNDSLGTGTLTTTMTSTDVSAGGLRVNADLSAVPNAIHLGATAAQRLVVNTSPDGAGPFTATFTGPVSGSGGFVKAGNGTVVLTGTKTYTGSTRVNGGRLLLTGTNSGTAAVTVNASGRLGGSGSKPAAVTVATTGGLVLDINTWATPSSGLTVNTLVLPAAPWTVDVRFSGAFSETNKTLPIITATGGITGFNVADVTISADANFPGNGTWVIQKTGNTLELVYTTLVVTDYMAWDALYPEDLSNPACDNDGDGLSNQQEYAFGLNPTLGSSVNPITVPLNKTTGMFTYTRRATPATTGLTYTVQTSTSLASWTADGGAVQTVTGTVSDVQTVQVTLSGAIPLTAPTIFVRVKATP